MTHPTSSKRQAALPAEAAAQLRRLRRACLKSQGGTLRYCCGHVACMVAGMFGGMIVVGRVNGEPHYWNRLPCGVEVDLTSCQYGGDGFTPLTKGRARKPPTPTPIEFLIFALRVQKHLGAPLRRTVEASQCT